MFTATDRSYQVSHSLLNCYLASTRKGKFLECSRYLDIFFQHTYFLASKIAQKYLNDVLFCPGLISHTALLAEKVSAKVRQLDLAKSRVAECQQRVHDLIDLRY